MQNIRIEVLRDNYIVVKADTLRFGNNEIMFEGNTFDDCFEYIKKSLNKSILSLTGQIVDGIYVDRKGRAFPCFMKVNI
jgi:hypothetical protein